MLQLQISFEWMTHPFCCSSADGVQCCIKPAQPIPHCIYCTCYLKRSNHKPSEEKLPQLMCVYSPNKLCLNWKGTFVGVSHMCHIQTVSLWVEFYIQSCRRLYSILTKLQIWLEADNHQRHDKLVKLQNTTIFILPVYLIERSLYLHNSNVAQHHYNVIFWCHAKA